MVSTEGATVMEAHGPTGARGPLPAKLHASLPRMRGGRGRLAGRPTVVGPGAARPGIETQGQGGILSRLVGSYAPGWRGPPP